jgi:hypothetical protein
MWLWKKIPWTQVNSSLKTICCVEFKKINATFVKVKKVGQSSPYIYMGIITSFTQAKTPELPGVNINYPIIV